MSSSSGKKSALASGWILVTALLLLCITGTGLTWWNYSRQVFSSAQGVVMIGADDHRVRVLFPVSDVIRMGHGATITVGEGKQVWKGRVLSVTPASEAGMNAVLIRLKKSMPFPPSGAPCSVTIDTTVPPMEGNY
jgi:hypothetical protein